MSTLSELFQFLHSPNPDARHLALQNLIGHTPKSSPPSIRNLFIPLGGTKVFNESGERSVSVKGEGWEGEEGKVEMIEDLKALCKDQAHIAHDALSALINLSDTYLFARHLVDEEFLTFLVSYTANHTSPLSPLTAMLLSNLTSHPSLTPKIATLSVPIMIFPPATTSAPIQAAGSISTEGAGGGEDVPPYFFPHSLSASSTLHPSYRPDLSTPPTQATAASTNTNTSAAPSAAPKTYTVQRVEAVRALVQAFEDGAMAIEELAKSNANPNSNPNQSEDKEGEGDGEEKGVGEGKARGKGKRKGGVHFLGSVFANISMLPSTRPLLLLPYPPFPTPLLPSPTSTSTSPSNSTSTSSPSPPTPASTSISASSSTPRDEDEPLLTKIVVFTEHGEIIRRGGALGCVKNAAMDRASHPFLLATESDRVQHPTDPSRLIKGVDVLPWVLSPLMGPEEIDIEESDALPENLQFLGPDKVRETDPVLRMMCVEILLLLATTYTGRRSLRDRGAYTVIRLAHAEEKDEQIQHAMIRLVGLLQREEGSETRGDVVGGLTKTGKEGGQEEGEEGDSDLEIEVI